MAKHDTDDDSDIHRHLQPALAIITSLGWDRAGRILPTMLAAAIAERDKRRKRREAA